MVAPRAIVVAGHLGSNVKRGTVPSMTGTTPLGSKGQVVIPARVRRALGWRAREKLSVEVEAALVRGYDRLERSRRDLVEALHESRERARARERRHR